MSPRVFICIWQVCLIYTIYYRDTATNVLCCISMHDHCSLTVIYLTWKTWWFIHQTPFFSSSLRFIFTFASFCLVFKTMYRSLLHAHKMEWIWKDDKWTNNGLRRYLHLSVVCIFWCSGLIYIDINKGMSCQIEQKME